MWGDAQDHYGSSPRMRGAHLVNGCLGNDSGIIPAYAGSTEHLPLLASGAQDHPRVCGEHRRSCRPPTTPRGSSPRMRRALGVVAHVHDRHGIIPAYAGSTARIRPQRYGIEDHPRVCGEHSGSSHSIGARVGSSPRMRGALGLDQLVVLLRGIIPAYAGSTCSEAAG